MSYQNNSKQASWQADTTKCIVGAGLGRLRQDKGARQRQRRQTTWVSVFVCFVMVQSVARLCTKWWMFFLCLEGTTTMLVNFFGGWLDWLEIRLVEGVDRGGRRSYEMEWPWASLCCPVLSCCVLPLSCLRQDKTRQETRDKQDKKTRQKWVDGQKGECALSQ